MANMGDSIADVTEMAARTSGKLQPLEEQVMYSPRGKLQHHTPLSQPSTAPSTPQLGCQAEGETHHSSIFFRCISGASTIEPVMEQGEFAEEDGWDRGISPLPPLAGEREEHEQVLEDRLAEVKQLFKERFGTDVDAESDDSNVEYDADGTPWIRTEGTGPINYDTLEDSLAEVKQLYLAKFGQDVDEVSEEGVDREIDGDGTLWVKTTGTGTLTYERLEDKLGDVKQLYLERFGKDIDEVSEEGVDREIDGDGTLWVKTTGTGPITYANLEDKLADVKQLYLEKFGRDVDEASEEGVDREVDGDGTLWVKTTGTGPLTCEKLEEKLADVKLLYLEKFGKDVDASSEEGVDREIDGDGTLWIKTTGTGPVTVDGLDDKLAEVKALFRSKFGADVDSESETDEEDEEEEEDLVYDADGTPWTKFVGTGPATMPNLEAKLDEVKRLYKQRFGKDADEASEDDDIEYDADGTPWIKTEGTGPINYDSLEDSLAEAKQLYLETFGRDVDEQSEEGVDRVVDADGTLWIKTTGTGPLTVEKLEDQLADVKQLFLERFGQDVDDESEEGVEREIDGDGTLWIKTTGTGLPEAGAEEQEPTGTAARDVPWPSTAAIVQDPPARRAVAGRGFCQCL